MPITLYIGTVIIVLLVIIGIFVDNRGFSKKANSWFHAIYTGLLLIALFLLFANPK